MTQTPIKTSKGRTFTNLVSKEGGVKYPLAALNVCEETFSPLEVLLPETTSIPLDI